MRAATLSGCGGAHSVAACAALERWPSGPVRQCQPTSGCLLLTSAGVLQPRTEPDYPRHPDVQPVDFHPDGQVQRVVMEQTIVTTPVGPLPAELALFHRGGALRRVFPVDGHLDGYWDEAQERQSAPTLEIQTPLGPLRACFIGVAFYPDGALQSLTLWPGEVLKIKTPLGQLWVRSGLSFHPDGSLESVEPRTPVVVGTPIGRISAFDPAPLGVNGDRNSLRFSAAGALVGLTTVEEGIVHRSPDGQTERWTPDAMHDGGPEEMADAEPLKLEFMSGRVLVKKGRKRGAYPIHEVEVLKTAHSLLQRRLAVIR